MRAQPWPGRRRPSSSYESSCVIDGMGNERCAEVAPPQKYRRTYHKTCVAAGSTLVARFRHPARKINSSVGPSSKSSGRSLRGAPANGRPRTSIGSPLSFLESMWCLGKMIVTYECQHHDLTSVGRPPSPLPPSNRLPPPVTR